MGLALNGLNSTCDSWEVSYNEYITKIWQHSFVLNSRNRCYTYISMASTDLSLDISSP